MGLLDQQRPMSFSGKRTATPYQGITAMDAARFVAEATPIIGDAMAAKEVYDELQKPDPNYAMVAALGGAALVGLVPGLGDAMAAGIKKGARGLLDKAKRIEVDPNALGMSFGNIKLNPKADPTQTGWTFRDVEKPTLNKEENRRVSALTSRVEEVPINQIYATQPTVNPDFSTTSSSAGELPFVVRKNGKMFVQDGHHRLTKVAEEGVQNAKVRFIDLDGADTSTPLLDYDPNFNSEVKGILDALSSPSLPKPKNKAEKTAKEILELRAKGEAKYVTDEMMSMADPQYMFNNTPLNMSEGARKLRADQLGYNKELFHGGQGGIKAMDADIAGGQDYDTGIWSTTDRYNANRYAGSPTENPTAGRDFSTDAFNLYDDRGAVYPLLGKTDNYAKTNFEGANWGDAPKYARMNFKQDGIPTRKKISDMTQDWASWASSPEAARAARTTDSSGLLIKDVVDIGSQFPHPDHIGLSPEMATTAVTFDPTTLRSKFARFDLEFKHLKNLTAAGLLAPGVLTAMQEYKKQQELERGLLSY